MIVEIFAGLLMAVVGLAVGFASFFYIHFMKKEENSDTEDANKSLLSLSQSKIVEMPVRKEKSPLYVFKNGEKQLFVMDSEQTFQIINK